MQKQQDLSSVGAGGEIAADLSGTRNPLCRMGKRTSLALAASLFALTALYGTALCGIAEAGSLQAAPLPADQELLAQSTITSGASLSAAEIRDCLCMEQNMNSMRVDISVRQDMLNERQQELANIDQQVKTHRAALAPDDTVGQQVLIDLMSQQQGLRNLLQNDLRPAYNKEVGQLNGIVAKYNDQCVSRPRYTADVKTAQQDLQCPLP